MSRKDPIYNNSYFIENKGDRIAVLGSLLSIVGDALQTIGGAIVLEEEAALEIKQQKEIAKLQGQIDELKKEQLENKPLNVDDEILNRLAEKLIARLDRETNQKNDE